MIICRTRCLVLGWRTGGRVLGCDERGEGVVELKKEAKYCF